MTSFSEAVLEKKLVELNNSQQSIQTLSLWLIHHRKHHKAIVQVWYRELVKGKTPKRLTFMYLANDVIQNSKKKGPEFTKEFGNILGKAFQHVAKNADDKTLQSLQRLLTIWQERGVYTAKLIDNFKNILTTGFSVPLEPAVKRVKKEPVVVKDENKSPPEVNRPHVKSVKKQKTQQQQQPMSPVKQKSPVKENSPPSVQVSTPKEPPDTEELIKALNDLENSASTDAAVREKIASLPPEVSDASLLDKIQDRAAGERLLQQVIEACTLLVDYNGRLSTELEDRRQLDRMLTDYCAYHKEQLVKDERRKEEYLQRLQKVTQVRSELKSHLQNLPDLTLLPAVTGGLAPLPSAGDLFNM